MTNPLWRTREGYKEKRSPKEAVQRLHKGDLETVQPTPSRPGSQVFRIDLAGVRQLSRSKSAASFRTTVGTKSQIPEHVERYLQQHQMKQPSSALTAPDCAFQE